MIGTKLLPTFLTLLEIYFLDIKENTTGTNKRWLVPECKQSRRGRSYDINDTVRRASGHSVNYKGN